MITDVPGFRVGHWTDPVARTGCTVVLCPEGATASGEVRGGAPASREFELLDPQRTMDRLDAVVLTGGSAFGLAAADGVMRHLEHRGVGFATPAGPVPIVVGLALFDLAVGDPSIRPGPDEGFAACAAASTDAPGQGPIGAGTGATLGKWRGPTHVRAAGLGSATVRRGPLVVSALFAVNAVGDLDDGAADSTVDDRISDAVWPGFANTTIGVVATNARVDKVGCLVVSQGAHDGLARALVPAHTRLDGDAVVAVATGAVEAGVDLVRMLAVRAVEAAVRATPTGPPGLAEHTPQ